MAFFGVFGDSAAARRVFDTRASYLCAPALHFSLDGRVALCYAGSASLSALFTESPSLFVATATKGGATLGNDTLTLFYRRYGKRLRRHLPLPTAFALYDARRARLLLGGTEGEKCFLEEGGDALFFSSDPTLLRTPVALDFAVLK